MRQQRNGGNSTSVTGTQQEDIWKKIWKLQTPNKIKHFFCGELHIAVIPSDLIWRPGKWTSLTDM